MTRPATSPPCTGKTLATNQGNRGPQFGFSRYAEKLAIPATTFDARPEAPQAPSNLPGQMLEELVD